MLIAHRNPHERQRLGLLCNGAACGSFDLYHTGLGAGHIHVLNVRLETGANLLQIGVSHWERNREDQRSLALDGRLTGMHQRTRTARACRT